MKTGSVSKIDLRNRVASVRINTGQDIPVDIPIDLSYVTVGCKVYIDNELGVLIKVIDTPDGNLDYFDPLSKNRRNNQNRNYSFSEGIDPKGGDYYQQPLHGGFLGLMKGWISMIGGGPLAQMRFFGTKKLSQLISDNFSWIGNKIEVSVVQGNEEGQPILSLRIGNLSLQINTAGNEITLELAGLLSLSANKTGATLSSLNPSSGEMEEVFVRRINGQGNPEFEYIFDNVLSRMTTLTLDIATTVELSAKQINVDAAELTLNIKDILGMTAKSLTMRVANKLKIHAGAEIHNIGDIGKPGNYQVNNGMLSHLRMNEFGVLSAYGPMIQLNGVGEFSTNALVMVQIITEMYSYLQMLNAGLFSVPGGQAIAAPGQTILAPIPAQIVQIPNYFIKQGVVPQKI